MDHVTVKPCGAPPVDLARHQRGVEWFSYEVRTASGRGEATGYSPGPEENARRAAHAALNALQRAEGLKPTPLPRSLALFAYKQRSWDHSQAKKPIRARKERHTLARQAHA